MAFIPWLRQRIGLATIRLEDFGDGTTAETVAIVSAGGAAVPVSGPIGVSGTVAVQGVAGGVAVPVSASGLIQAAQVPYTALAAVQIFNGGASSPAAGAVFAGSTAQAAGVYRVRGMLFVTDTAGVGRYLALNRNSGGTDVATPAAVAAPGQLFFDTLVGLAAGETLRAVCGLAPAAGSIYVAYYSLEKVG